MLVKIAIKSRGNNFQLYHWSETYIAALMHWTVNFHSVNWFHTWKKIPFEPLYICFSLKRESFCLSLVESKVLLLAVRMFQTVVAATIWMWNVFSGWQNDSHHGVFCPSQLAQLVGFAFVPFLRELSTRPGELLPHVLCINVLDAAEVSRNSKQTKKQ